MEESLEDGNKRIKSLTNEDRISSMPDSIIHHILSLLPSTEDAIRTTILSKRWQNQWTRVPVLIFKSSSRSGDTFFSFIENTLLLHDCPEIKKFHLDYRHCSESDPRIISKIRFAIRKCVQELILQCDCCELPQFLFENASLVRLEMVNCYFNPSWIVNWPSLKSLKMDLNDDPVTTEGIANVVSGSPSLERLELFNIDGDHVAVVSKSLKVLSLVGGGYEIKILCPNLVELNVIADDSLQEFPEEMIENALSGSPFLRSFKLVGCAVDDLVIASKSLKVLHLEDVVAPSIFEVSCPNLEKLYFSGWEGNIFKSVNLPSSICATLDNPCGMEKELLEQFQHVNKLTIGSRFLEAVSSLDVEVRLSLPLLNSQWSTLNVLNLFRSALPGIAYVLCSPMLETLVINLEILYYFKERLDEDLHDYWNSNASTGFTCLESRLKIVKIIGLRWRDDENCKPVLEFIEFLLKNARVLEKMIVVLKKAKKDFVIEVCQKLLSFPRYSRCANIELICST